MFDKLKERALELKMGFDDLIMKIDELWEENKELKKEIAELKAENERLKQFEEPPLSEWCCLEGLSGFSNNFMYDDYRNHIKSRNYKGWQCNFPFDKLWKKEVWEAIGVDFSKDIQLLIRVIQPKNLDTSNCVKSIQDQLIQDTRGLCIDDSIVVSAKISRIDTCSKYQEGKIYYYIRNYIPEID